MFKKLIATALVAVSAFAFASDQDKFCAGFEEGFKSVKGNFSTPPVCPAAPPTPPNSTPFREGIKAGIAAGNK